MSTPRATVRLQLHAGFTFRDAADTVDYYARLGISHFYVSPIFTARKGSTHGYDVIDPCSINPELGGDQGLRHLVDRLRAADMGLIIDIVPNHMGVAEGNRYWEDVLACGPASRYASWFDVDWDSPDPRLKGKLLLPVLGDAYQAVLQSGDLKLAFDAEEHRLFLMCYDKRLPLSQASTEDLLAGATGAAAKQLMEERLSRFDTRTPGGLEALHALLEAQHYRLSWWRNAAEEINWRRFFEVSDLAGVRVELEEVFEATHRLVFSLYGQGLIDGVRVDHVDGLADPAGYCRRLRSRLSQLQTQRPPGMTSGRAWIVVEKILSPGETLPLEWEVDGTTGYDFMDQAGKVLHDPRGEEALRNAWAEWTHDASSFEQQLSAARQQLLSENFVGELDALTHALVRHARTGALGGHDVAWSAVRRVLVALLTAFRRYRSYTTPEGTSALDQQVLEKALQEARRLVRPPDQALLTQVASWLVVQPATDGPTSESASAGATVLRAVTRFQQLTPPLAAKAMEDTVFYRYAPLLSRNEVGSFPGEVPGGLEAFHADNLRRASDYPLGMLTTATHDHKRGEDARARLAVLSEVPGVWEEKLDQWMGAHAGLRTSVQMPDGSHCMAPGAADQIMLYQTLFGAWPPGFDPSDAQARRLLSSRVAAWQEKALREAKLASSWMAPQQDYEAACRVFLDALLDGADAGSFAREMGELVAGLTPAAHSNAMTQTLLRLTSPGIPDLYQGSELDDFSLVDPDNRRPVDMARRRAALATPAAGGPLQEKQSLIADVLRLRRQHPLLFAGGEYLPLKVVGGHRDHVIAFARRHEGVVAITVALRHAATLHGGPDAGAAALTDTRALLPEGFPVTWRHALTDKGHAHAAAACLPLAEVMGGAPVALLVSEPV